MKRFHVHVAVPDLQQGVRFYSTVFGAQPSIVKPDYAKWMLDEPRLNFAISKQERANGVNHLGFQVDEASELDEIHSRLAAADAGLVEEKNVSCCYARSNKYWITDPAGIAWETFHTLGAVPTYSGEEGCGEGEGACCATTPSQPEKASCCG